MERRLHSTLNTSRWLEAVWDPTAKLNVLPGGLEMFDIVGDGEARLIVVDLPEDLKDLSKIRVFKETQCIVEIPMLEPPCGVVGLYTETDEPRSAVIAVGVGSHVFIYKNMKPHFKYSLPKIDAHPKEREIWQKAYTDSEINIIKLCDDLQLLTKELGGSFMTARTLTILSMEEKERLKFAERFKNIPLTKANCLCTISVIRKDSWNDPACSCLVLGTELGDMFVLDPRSFSLTDKLRLGWAPAAVATTGLWSGDGRIYVVSREEKIGYLTKGMSSIKLWNDLESRVVTMTTLPAEGLALLNMDGFLLGYSNDGIKLWEVKLISAALDMISIPVPQSCLSLLAISVPQAGVLIYDGQHHVDTIKTMQSISTMKFGRMGQEERALALVTVEGGLYIKILKRTANFNTRIHDNTSSSTRSQNLPKIPTPKMSKLFKEQEAREKAHAKEIYNAFERDFLQLQLTVAKKAHELIYSKQASVSYSFTIESSVLGLGPTYLIRTVVTSFMKEGLNGGYLLLFRSNPHVEINRRMLALPLLLPGSSTPAEVRATPNSLLPERVQVLLCKEDKIDPICVTAVILPVPEPDIEV